MKKLNLDDVTAYVEEHIGTFHNNRLEKLEKLRLLTVLKRKNPYLFKAKNILTAEGLIRSILDAYLSSQEETLFGDFLEGVAIFVCEQVYAGYKPSTDEFEGIDAIFQHHERLFIVEIKSGPNWGNSSQIGKMIINFDNARTILQEQHSTLEIIAVNGCSYGRDANHSKRDGRYWKLCGQDFWRFISGNDDLYMGIIEPLGHRAKQQDENFQEAYAKIINRFTLQFAQEYCLPDGAIDWEKLVQLVSQRTDRTTYPFNNED
ncbi:MAG: PmeII family type II restriction endonuclease [Anaerolineae bacterium]|nr:PmeII family type II restriction endonuclease [Anaerolineae bacterium]